jgi:hypothetical protein
VGAAVERVRERHDALATGGDAGDLDGVLDRLGAGVDEEHALGRRPGRDRGEPLGHGHVALVHADGEAQVLELRRLPLHGLDHARVRVADVHHGDADGPVEVARAVGVPDVAASALDGEIGWTLAAARVTEAWRRSAIDRLLMVPPRGRPAAFGTNPSGA